MKGEVRDNKRPREESPHSPETKRLREADIFLEILDDDNDDVDSGAGSDLADDDLANVIKILEEAITAPADVVDAVGPRQLDLGYLLEASDDELGLPPPATGLASFSPSTDGDVVEVVDDGPETVVFDGIWGFEDEISLGPYECFEFGIPTEFDDGAIFDGRLFGYSDVAVSEPSDYEDWTYRTESLRAI